jgi:hypothetical protein
MFRKPRDSHYKVNKLFILSLTDSHCQLSSSVENTTESLSLHLQITKLTSPIFPAHLLTGKLAIQATLHQKGKKAKVN